MVHYLSRLLVVQLCLFSFLSVIVVYGGEFYVSPDGNDESQGTLESPWRSLEYSVTQLSPGDTLYLRGGVYSESFWVLEGGEENNPISIRNFEDENPVIDGSSVDAENGLVLNTAHLELLGLEIRNWGCGIWAESCSDIKVTDCTVHEVGSGIGFADGSHNFTLRNCYMYSFDLYGFDASPSGGADCYDGAIINCTAGHGRDPEQNVDGFALGHGDQHGFRLINCIAFDVADGFDISADKTMLVGCLADSCYTAGYKIWGDEVTLMNCIGHGGQISNLELDWSGTPKTVSVINCDMIDAETFNVWVENPKDTLILYNSIIVGGKNIGIAFESGLEGGYIGDYNLFQNDDQARIFVISYEDEYSLDDLSSGDWTGFSGQDTHTVTLGDVNDVFVDAENNDFSPIEASPVIDHGGDEYNVSFDYDDLPRPNGEGVDIGAYEYYDNRPDSRGLPKVELPMHDGVSPKDNQVKDTTTGLQNYMLLLFGAIIFITIIVIFLRRR
jgi:hypothetical protein